NYLGSFARGADRRGVPGAGETPPRATHRPGAADAHHARIPCPIHGGPALMEVGLEHYLVLGAILFVCGVVCMASKRNAIGVLIGVELVLNGANINFVAFAHYNPVFEIEGMVFALFVIVLAAAEAAVALAIVLNFYNNHLTVDVDTAEELKG